MLSFAGLASGDSIHSTGPRAMIRASRVCPAQIPESCGPSTIQTILEETRNSQCFASDEIRPAESFIFGSLSRDEQNVGDVSPVYTEEDERVECDRGRKYCVKAYDIIVGAGQDQS
jgi:hypothetical protein